MLAVIFFHAHVPGFAGGYVGVDVFFVISGYLITQVLMAPSGPGLGEQLRTFYVRRCRRILPALIVMLLGSTLVALWVFLPGELTRFGRYVAYALVLIANVAVWRDGGYFDVNSAYSPLLHLWSIAVEEQFYLVFPLIFLLSGKAGSNRRFALFAVAALASLALCVWGSYYKPGANFFLAPTRAWELLLGSLAALGLGRSLSVHPARGAFAVAALVALLGCVAFYDNGTRYPGLYALVPCVSTAILLATASQSHTHVSGWLSARPLVFTGLISYSLYLWHLPLLAFAAYYNIHPLTPGHLAILLPALYVLSVASWRYVEAPIRGRTLLKADSRFLVAAGSAAAIVASLGVLLWQTQGLSERSSEAERRLLGNSDRLRQDTRNCVRPLSAVAAGELCRYGPDAGVKADVLVWGDSHAMVLIPAYERIAAARNVDVRMAVLYSCRPLLDAASKTEQPQRRKLCQDFNRAVVSAIDAINPALVILNAYWLHPDLDIVPTGAETEGSSPPFEAALEHTLKAIGLGRRKVCIVGDVPELDYRMPYAYAVALRRGIDPSFVALPSADAKLQLRDVTRDFTDLEQRLSVKLVQPADVLCAGPTCSILTADGDSLYGDDNHLSINGARFVARSLDACFDGIG